MASRSPARATALARGGERFGKYETLRRIAVGGMAEIHLARAVGLEGFEKLVVLKRILPQYADDEEFVRMFLDEARLAATLHHSNVVQVYDIGAVDGQYFLSMEFLHGQDGRQLMKTVAASQQPLPLENAIAIMIGVLAGLHYAHERVVDGKPLNLVHRDVSPQNVFVTYDGGVKLLDFGIARASSRLSETRAGTLKGKIAYMSPEQCSGLPIDRRSDVFAAAIILWELTTGRRLFTGDSDFEVMRKIKEEDSPRPSAGSFAYPLALERIVLKGLKRDPAERYASAEEMQLELEAFVREQRLPVSAVGLGRWMRETFRDDLARWERLSSAAEPIVQPAGEGSLVRTETSVPGPAPPMLYSDPAVPTQPRHSRARGWVAVTMGIVAGSFCTWLIARGPSQPFELVPAAHPIAAPAPSPPPTELPDPRARIVAPETGIVAPETRIVA
ncbi:MAG: hypothetical protein JWM53_489, partial [bacterium]|nr:hypothetical protein [bacterium]